MRNPHGYVRVTEGVPKKGGDLLGEMDTFQCSHCGRHVYVKANANLDDLGNMCRGCMQMICPQCVGKPIVVYGQEIPGACVPFKDQLDIMEARARLREAAGA